MQLTVVVKVEQHLEVTTNDFVQGSGNSSRHRRIRILNVQVRIRRVIPIQSDESRYAWAVLIVPQPIHCRQVAVEIHVWMFLDAEQLKIDENLLRPQLSEIRVHTS